MIDRAHIEISHKEAWKFFLVLIALDTLLAGVFLFDVMTDSLPKMTSRMFNLAREGGFPAWFTAVKLSMAGVLIIFCANRCNKHVKNAVYTLTVAGIGFIYLSADEVVGLHEKLGRTLKHYEWLPRFSDNHGIWMLIYILIALVLFLIFHRSIFELIRQFTRSAKILIAGFIVAFTGAFLLEIPHYYLKIDAENPLMHFMQVLAEEYFELVGVSILLYGSVHFMVELFQLPASDEPANRIR